MSLTTFTVVVQSSGNSSQPPKARLISSLNYTQQSSFLIFHHLILGSVFAIFRFLQWSPSSSCTPTADSVWPHAPTLSLCNLLSLSGRPSYIGYGPLAYSFSHTYASLCVLPLLEIRIHHIHFHSCREIHHHLSFCVSRLVSIPSHYVIIASSPTRPLKTAVLSNVTGKKRD